MRFTRWEPDNWGCNGGDDQNESGHGVIGCGGNGEVAGVVCPQSIVFDHWFDGEQTYRVYSTYMPGWAAFSWLVYKLID